MAQTANKKRGQGRPLAGDSGVGREGLIAAARRLLQLHPPARVTLSSIAREAGSDPALVRYYFGSRTNLLLEVVERMTSALPQHVESDKPALQVLAEHIHGTFGFTRSAKNMHRLMVEELSEEGSEESRERLREINLAAVRFYDDVMRADGGATLKRVDPVFLHLMLVGVSDFFASSQAVVRELVPAGTDVEELTRRYEAFVIDVVTNGLAVRENRGE